jgi:hypothetical protein
MFFNSVYALLNKTFGFVPFTQDAFPLKEMEKLIHDKERHPFQIEAVGEVCQSASVDSVTVPFIFNKGMFNLEAAYSFSSNFK